MSSRSLLSEEQFKCSICLDVFTESVSITCGHNFCKACIAMYCQCDNMCQCPFCMEQFYGEPDFKKLDKQEFEFLAKPGEGSIEHKLTSKNQTKWMNPLVKLTDKKEKLMNPVDKMVSPGNTQVVQKMCKKHHRPLEMFCKRDQTCVCVMCIKTDHEAHYTIPLQEEYKETKVQLGIENGGVQHMIQERLEKVQEIQLSIEISKSDAEREISDSIQAFTALVHSIEKSQAELIEVIEEKQKAAEKRAEGFIKDLEQEITELKRRSTELEQLSHTEDHLHLLQSFPSLSTPPHTKDWSEISVHSDLSIGTARRAVCQIEDTLVDVLKKLCEAELRRTRQYAVDVTLDPDTAHPRLRLSDDGKRVKHGYVRKDLPDNPERFDPVVLVLGKQGLSSGRFYYEVQVEGKTEWDLGVARESINRKGEVTVSPEKGHWTIWLRNGSEYMALTDTPVLLSLKQKPQKVGVFVDYEDGQVSFYDVEATFHIYSYTGCTFTEKLYPYLSPCLNDEGTNSAPLIITPVQKS
ncbi:E3 ubiquitin-protein ligase TRIM39-like [Osmerus eperlanus]|uniref:E3 ubiquitin-protein ligase TRIM39-like n=1 Tax=Osmerus eperlanus TaxID=29151 RepID=UPI002E0E88D0